MKKLLSRVLSAILLFGCCGIFAGCMEKEDCIPETLGQAEGLYLYYNNYRSFTDGTEEETLLSEITIDGNTYTDEDFEIVYLEYATTVKEIIYSIAVPQEESTSYYVWHYNYDTKESGLLFETSSYAWIDVSEHYILLKIGSGNFPKTLLLDLQLNIVEENFVGWYYLYEDYLYKATYYNFGKFSWWKDGTFHEIQTVKKELSSSHCYVTSDYAYLFYDSVLFLVDMNSGEYKTHNLGENEILKDWHGFLQRGDKLYCITTSQITQTNLKYFPLETGCRLYCLQGFDVTLLYTFNKEYQMEFDGGNDKYLNFEIEQFKTYLLKEDATVRFHGYYDIEKNSFVKGKTKNVQTEKENFKIGEYEFYSDRVKYGPLMGHYYCYYLHRITNGKDEILLYHFDESNGACVNPVLFDDIYTK